MARVTLQNVAKSFGGDRGPWAVQDFSLDIADGELVVFVGPSGCGKSTTLRMLAGLDVEPQQVIPAEPESADGWL